MLKVSNLAHVFSTNHAEMSASGKAPGLLLAYIKWENKFEQCMTVNIVGAYLW